MNRYSPASQPLYAKAVLGFRQLTNKKRTPETLLRDLACVDPSGRGKNIRWLCERLAARSFIRERHLWDIQQGDNSHAYRLLLAFEACKAELPIDQRNILDYQNLTELDHATRSTNARRTRCNTQVLLKMSEQAVFNSTMLAKVGGLSMHEPRSIEEAATLLGNSEVLDQRGQGLYAALRIDGAIRVFMSETDVVIGALPEEAGTRSLVFDSMGELAVFEDMLSVESLHSDLSWKNYEPVMRSMVLIDPTLPFDTEMDEVEPYEVALLQFPFVLFEDRQIPEHLLDQVLSNPDVFLAVSEFL
jgi:hypothetical protein